MSAHTAQWVSTVVLICGALGVIVVRLRASRKPTNARKIMIPPVGMSTGYLMFIAPQTHVPFLYAVAAFAVGVLLSYPLILTSRMTIVEDQIYLKRSPAFVAVLLGLVALRIALHNYVEAYVSIVQTGALFFVLAFGMILPWRVAMVMEYRRLSRKIVPSRATAEME